ncbi:MAG: cytochrome P450 [Alphaproteobacteria bacterium]|nr:cytochrome P450 [Alphaproteobacteria bacterium]
MPLPPGPALPRAVQTFAYATRPQSFVPWCAQRYGVPYTLRLVGQTMVIVADPEHVRMVISGQDKRLTMSRYNHIVDPIVGRLSLLVTDGQRHAHHRRMLLEPFRRAKVLSYGPDMADIAARHLSGLAPGVTVSAYEAFEKISLEVILRIVLGVRDAAQVVEARAALEPVVSVNPLILMFPALQRDLGPWSPGGRFRRDRERLDAFLFKHIATRRAAVEAGDPPTDVLGQLILAEDEDGRLSDQALRDELMTLIFTGHETTAAGLSWTLGWLVRSPEALARLVEELDALGPDVSLETLDAAPWLDAVCKEALRMSPVFPGIPREVVEPIRIGDYTLPEGTQIVATAALSHRMPGSFDAPDTFDPAHFLDRKYSREVYYPFGGGPRMCLGWAFGVSQMKLVLARALANFTFAASDGRWPNARWRHVTMVPHQGGPVRVVGRRTPPAASPLEQHASA